MSRAEISRTGGGENQPQSFNAEGQTSPLPYSSLQTEPEPNSAPGIIEFHRSGPSINASNERASSGPSSTPCSSPADQLLSLFGFPGTADDSLSAPSISPAGEFSSLVQGRLPVSAPVQLPSTQLQAEQTTHHSFGHIFNNELQAVDPVQNSELPSSTMPSSSIDNLIARSLEGSQPRRPQLSEPDRSRIRTRCSGSGAGDDGGRGVDSDPPYQVTFVAESHARVAPEPERSQQATPAPHNAQHTAINPSEFGGVSDPSGGVLERIEQMRHDAKRAGIESYEAGPAMDEVTRNVTTQEEKRRRAKRKSAYITRFAAKKYEEMLEKEIASGEIQCVILRESLRQQNHVQFELQEQIRQIVGSNRARFATS